MLGFYQWRRQHGHPSRAANAEARRKAHLALWQKLEDINLKLRDGKDNNPELHRLIREVNILFTKNSIYFDDNDQKPINDYVAAMNHLRTVIFTSGDEDVEHSFSATSWDINVDDPRIRSASDDVKRLRAQVKKKIQRITSQV